MLVPALPEVVTEGATEGEALANAEEAIRAVLAYRHDRLKREIEVGLAELERGNYEEVDDAELDAWLDRLGDSAAQQGAPDAASSASSAAWTVSSASTRDVRLAVGSLRKTLAMTSCSSHRTSTRRYLFRRRG